MTYVMDNQVRDLIDKAGALDEQIKVLTKAKDAYVKKIRQAYMDNQEGELTGSAQVTGMAYYAEFKMRAGGETLSIADARQAQEDLGVDLSPYIKSRPPVLVMSLKKRV